MQNSALSPPKSSTLSRIVAMGQFVTPQNSAAMPMAAPNAGLRPTSSASVPPSVAPMNSVGTISPPLKPAPIVMEVKIILSRNASGRTTPSSKMRSMTSIPPPLYARVPTSNVSKITTTPPTAARRNSFLKSFLKSFAPLCIAQQNSMLTTAHKMAMTSTRHIVEMSNAGTFSTRKCSGATPMTSASA